MENIIYTIASFIIIIGFCVLIYYDDKEEEITEIPNYMNKKQYRN